MQNYCLLFSKAFKKKERRGCLLFCSLSINPLSKNVDLLGYFLTKLDIKKPKNEATTVVTSGHVIRVSVFEVYTYK